VVEVPGCWPLHSPPPPLQLLLLPPPEEGPCIAGATGEYMTEGELSGDSALVGFTSSGSGSSNACDSDVDVADLIDEAQLREHLDHARTLRLTRGESTWLRGNTFYGKRQMFSSEFMEWLDQVQLPPYELATRGGQFELTFEGSWPEVMLWEVPALAVLTELRSRAVLHSMGHFDLQVLYARAMTTVTPRP